MKARTIYKPVKATGIGLHTGDMVTISLHPAPPETGIVFKRVDLNPPIEVKATAQNIGDTQLCSCLVASGIRIATIEHLMSALAALGIDDLYIEINGSEMPIMDGSANPFVFLIQSAGIAAQNTSKKFIKIKKKIFVGDANKHAYLEPFSGCRFSFQIDFNHPLFESKHCSARFDLSTAHYIQELSRARTFGFLQELEELRRLNLIRGGSLDNAIVVDKYRVLNPEGLRYEDEFVRHKILDAIGDLYLLGHNMIGSYHGFKSGHQLNNELCRALLADQTAWELVTFEPKNKSPFTIPNFNINLINQFSYPVNEKTRKA